MDSVVVCRYGELFLKSGNRRSFERVLADNARRALADLPAARVSQTHGRLLVRLPEAEADDAATRLQRVFGLVSLSVARQVEATRRSRGRGSRRRRHRARRDRARRRRVVQDRSAPRRQALPRQLDGDGPPHRCPRAGGHRPGRRRPHARAAPGHRGRHRRGVRVRRHPGRARWAARRRVGPRAAAAVGRHRFAGRGLAGRQARPGAGRRLLPFAALRRREVPRQGADAGGQARALAGAALGDRRPVHRRAEAPARRRPRRAGGRALPAHDDAHRRRHRRRPGLDWPGDRREPGTGRQPDDREPDRDRRRRAPRRAAAACSPTTRSRRRRSPSASAPSRRRSSRSKTAARCSCPPHPATRARVVDAEKAEAKLDVAAEIAAAVAGSERIVV